jgi:hypothetical protein
MKMLRMVLSLLFMIPAWATSSFPGFLIARSYQPD